MVPSIPSRLASALLLNYMTICLQRAAPSPPEQQRDTWLIYDPEFVHLTDAIGPSLAGQAVRVIVMDANLTPLSKCTIPSVTPNIITLVTAKRLAKLVMWVHTCLHVTSRPGSRMHLLVVQYADGDAPIPKQGGAKIAPAIIRLNATTGDWKMLHWRNDVLVQEGNDESCATLAPTKPWMNSTISKPVCLSKNVAVPGLSLMLRSTDGTEQAVGSGVSAVRLVAEALGWSVEFQPFDMRTVLIKHPVGKALLPGLRVYGRRRPDNELNTHVTMRNTIYPPLFNFDVAVLVPYDVLDESNIVATIISNAPIVLVWLTAALVFTALRLCFECWQQTQYRRRRPFVYIYFDTLARSLGSSCGDTTEHRSSAMLIFVLSCFAILASALCAGALYEQQFVYVPKQRIDTLDELYASKMDICYVSTYIGHALLELQSGVKMTSFPMTQIKKMLLDGNTNYAYLVGENLLPTLEGKYRADNKTPVYHVMSEKIKNVGCGFRLGDVDLEWHPRLLVVSRWLLEAGLFAQMDHLTMHFFRSLKLGISERSVITSVGSVHLDVGDRLMWVIYGLGVSASLISFVVELCMGKMRQRQ